MKMDFQKQNPQLLEEYFLERQVSFLGNTSLNRGHLLENIVN